jgi:[ribosomal protein S5]-alanine N-acetyltransferase
MLVSQFLNPHHLQLRPVTWLHKTAFLRGKDALAEVLQVYVPEHWPHFPQAFALRADEHHEPEQLLPIWRGYLFIHLEEGKLIGNGGFKGPPDAAGAVEIGYEIATEYWNRGFATQAARSLIDFAFSHQQVNAVIAHTLAEKNASNSVLQKAGMQFVAEVDDLKVGKKWRWQITRTEYRQV